MNCSAGCGERADVRATREGEEVVLLLCWEHGRALAAFGDIRLRPVRSGWVDDRRGA